MILRMGRWLLLAALAGCGAEEEIAADELPRDGEVVDPPFDVGGEAEGLLLVWFDAEGLHTAQRRSDIPEAHRGAVRVDDLSLDPEERLDPELVYVADLRPERHRTVRRMPRDTFDRMVSAASRAPEPIAEAPDEAPPEVPADGDVVIYGASWCSACRSAAAYLRSRNVPFVERDIERDPGARDAMQRAARTAGVRTNGIPVIDFRGRIIAGFDRAALDRAIADTTT